MAPSRITQPNTDNYRRWARAIVPASAAGMTRTAAAMYPARGSGTQPPLPARRGGQKTVLEVGRANQRWDLVDIAGGQVHRLVFRTKLASVRSPGVTKRRQAAGSGYSTSSGRGVFQFVMLAQKAVSARGPGAAPWPAVDGHAAAQRLIWYFSRLAPEYAARSLCVIGGQPRQIGQHRQNLRAGGAVHLIGLFIAIDAVTFENRRAEARSCPDRPKV